MTDHQEPHIPPGQSIVGKCSICGGLVAVPSVWMSILPAVPRCLSCGATQKPHDPWAHLPTIPMERASQERTIVTITDKTAP